MLPESVGVVKRYRDREATREQEIGDAAPLCRRQIAVYRNGRGSRDQAQGN